MRRILFWASIAMITVLTLFSNPAGSKGRRSPAPTGPDTLVLAVQGMVCQGCELAIESVVSKLSGVLGVEANHEKAEVRVAVEEEGGPSLATLAQAVSKAGYSPKLPQPERTPLSGHWSAVVHRDGEDHRIVMDLDVLESRWVGEFDVPSFGLENYPVEVALSDTAVDLHFAAVAVDFHGQLSSDADSLLGIARPTAGNEEPFGIEFHRSGAASFSEMFLALEAAAEDSSAVRILSGLEELKAAFNRDSDNVRLLMLLAPS